MVKLGKRKGCFFDDRFDVEFSPMEMERLERHFLQEALHESDYYTQGMWRTLKERFELAQTEWQAQRKILYPEEE